MSRDDLYNRDFNNYSNRRSCRCDDPCSPRFCLRPYVGPTGPQGEPGVTGPQGEPGQAGLPGGPGPAGPKGDKGEAGAAGPKGDKGEAGAAGPKGDKGEAGAAGPKGDKGDLGLAGPKGDKGDPGAAGPKGDKGDPGLAGPKGDKGDSGTVGPKGDKGEHGSAGSRGETGPPGSRGDTGPAGPSGPPGDLGPTGPQGERGPIAATIAFSLSSDSSGQGSMLSTDAQGDPYSIDFVGFSGLNAYDRTLLQPGDWAAHTISIDNDTPYPSSFIMPYDASLRKIHVLFANRSELNLGPGVILRPFACIAVSTGNSLDFSILPNTITYTEPYVGGEIILKYGLRRGSLTNLDIPIAEGTLVGIVVGFRGEGPTPEYGSYFSVSGGLFLD